MVDARVKRKGKRFYCKNVDEAKVKAEALAQERCNDGIEALAFPTALRIEATQGQGRLKVWNATISQAVDHYVAWLESEQLKRDSLLVEDCVGKYLEARRRDHHNGSLSKLSLYEITARAKQFGSAFQGQRIRDLDRRVMQKFLDSMPVSARTKVNVRLRASKMFNWLRDQDLISENPVEKIHFALPEKEITILTPDELMKLLRAASSSPDLLLYVLLQAFQGLRPGEAEQMTYERIDLAANSLHVHGPSSKSRRTRYLSLNETFLRWAAPHLNGSGSIVQPNLRKRYEQVKRNAGWDTNSNRLPTDVLRHCFGSYWLAVHQDAGRLATLMGNSEDVIFDHYRKIIPLPLAQDYWNLECSTCSQQTKSD